ncbi:MAG: hypothetical protein IKE75_00225 [Bacilli bacterium]|nr:hypothetical protein [Bacilli bacterium]
MENPDNFNEQQEAFTEYIETVKKLPLLDKKKETLNSIKELIASIDLAAQNEDIELHHFTSKEISDDSDENMSDDEYVETLLAYIELAKSVVSEYLLQKMQN